LRKFLIPLLVLLLGVFAFAQQRTGNIFIKVTDKDGSGLPGVTVTMTGPFGKIPAAVTSAEGAAKFLSLPPSRDYTVKLELPNFKTKTETGIVVNVGVNANMTIVMEQGVIEEQITVVGKTPVVDSKKTSIGTNVTQELLQSLPTARDPWVILQMAPSIITDRENVGGNESGQQSNYVARGATSYNDNVWAMDGVVITDPAAIGASPSYYDFDAFEEMSIIVGGADVTVQTGGIALNMVTRRAGNKISLGGRFYVTDSMFQAGQAGKWDAEFQATAKATGYSLLSVNKIDAIRDYGFNLGIPVIKDKIWFWGSYGVQDIHTFTMFQTKDDTLLQNYAAKLNIQIIPENRFEAFIHSGGKYKWGRSTSAANPEGLFQQGRFHLGSPIIKLQDEHMFGENLFVSLKFAYADAGFSLIPMTDLNSEKLALYDVTAQKYADGYSKSTTYMVIRPTYQYNAVLNYFNDSLLGASHDIKIGFEYADRAAYTESTYSGNVFMYRNYNTPQFDSDGNGTPDQVPAAAWKRFDVSRGYYRDQGVKALSGYFQDTLSFGKLNLLLGLRFDYQTPSVNPLEVLAYDGNKVWTDYFTTEAQNKLDSLLPTVKIDKIDAKATDGSKWGFKTWSPRLGLTYDLFGNGKTIVKLNAARYGQFMGTGSADMMVPGGTAGWMRFWWNDVNANGKVDLNELWWLRRRSALAGQSLYSMYRAFDDAGNYIGDSTDANGYFYGGYDINNPLLLTQPYGSRQANAQDTRTDEAIFTVEREIFTDFAVSVNATYRKYSNFNWSLKYFKDANGNNYEYQNQGWYIDAGVPPADLPGFGSTKEAANHDWYYTSSVGTATSNWYESQRRPDYNMQYLGFDLILNKRLSNKWMVNANFTWQWQAQYYGSKGYLSATNLWAYEGQPQAASIGSASGKINQYTYSRWMLKAGGLYQAPFDIDVSFTFQAREGWIQTESFTFVNYLLPNSLSNSAELQMSPFGSAKLPLFYNFTLRVEKMIKLGDVGRIYFMADMFNVFNFQIENRRYQKYWGTYYYYGEGSASNRFVPNLTYNLLNEILNPSVVRFGVRFQF